MSFINLIILFIGLAFKSLSQPTLLPDFNFLILGLDPRNDSLEQTQVTDTIILGRLTSDAQIKITSLPRDLWSYSLKTKINQIYPLSLNVDNQYDFIQKNFQQITGQPINRTLILTTQNLIDLVTILGGVDVHLEKGFIDNQYPNPEYIKNPSPKVPVYKTIEFASGINHLDESNITEFVRSRKSAQTASEGGTDIGRTERQQLLIDAIINKLKSPDILSSSDKILSLYNFYHQNISTNFTDVDIASLAIRINRHFLKSSITKITIPTGENPETDILYYPGKLTLGQWAFIPQDQDYSRFHLFLHQHFSP
jgi:anionic cell wall polymer biosynthesis LytR-Cps2A-Psr (LCP) family protein